MGQFGNEYGVRDSLSQTLESINEENDKLKIITEFCESHYTIDTENVIRFAREGIQLAESIKDSFEISKLWRLKGTSEYWAGETNEALQSLNRSLEICKASKDSLNMAKTYAELGFYYDAIGEMDRARDIYSMALPIATDIRSYDNIQTIRCYQAILLKREGQYQEAIALYDSILVFSNIHQLDTLRIIRNKAQALTNMGKYNDALDIYLNAKKVYDPNTDHLAFAQMDHNIAFILRQNKLYRESLNYYNRVYDYFSKQTHIFHFVIINEAIGAIKIELDELEEAEQYLLKGFALRKENGIGRTGIALEHLGLLKIKQQKYNEADDYLMRALDSLRLVNNKLRESETLSHLAQLHLDQGAISKAIAFADSSRVIASNCSFDQIRSLALGHLVEAHNRLGHYEEVYLLQQEWNALKEKLSDPEKMFRLSQQIILQKVNDSTTEASTTKPQKINLWFYLFLTALAGIVFFIYKNVKKQQSDSIITPVASAPRPKKYYITTAEAEKLKSIFDAIMNDQKPYLNTELKLKDLAQAASTTDKKLSAFLNEHLDVSFYDYINTWRIEEFKSQADQIGSKGLSIIGLAYVCGFKSKSSFYRCFKKELGMSPSEYLKNLPT